MRDVLKKLLPKHFKSAYRNYKKFQYLKSIKGNDVYCPICNSYFKFFASGGMDNRLNARCHTCNSLERHRLLYLYIDQKFSFFENQTTIRLLHFAPEKCFYNIFSNMKHIDYVPCDLCPEIYNYKGGAKISRVDMTAIPFGDMTFDFILHNQVLEHIPNDRLAMKELFRVMKANGSGIFQVPIDYSREKTYEDFTITSPEERTKAFGQHDHVRWYGRDYKKRLERCGFKVTEDAFVKQFTDEDICKYGLTPTELIYFCKKSENYLC